MHAYPSLTFFLEQLFPGVWRICLLCDSEADGNSGCGMDTRAYIKSTKSMTGVENQYVILFIFFFLLSIANEMILHTIHTHQASKQSCVYTNR